MVRVAIFETVRARGELECLIPLIGRREAELRGIGRLDPRDDFIAHVEKPGPRETEKTFVAAAGDGVRLEGDERGLQHTHALDSVDDEQHVTFAARTAERRQVEAISRPVGDPRYRNDASARAQLLDHALRSAGRDRDRDAMAASWPRARDR